MKFEYENKTFHIDGVSDEDHIYKRIVNTGTFYEIDLLGYVRSLKDYMGGDECVAIDVGANIGNHSIYFQSFVSDHLIAVEPNPDVLPVLKRNLANNISNYTVYDCALGEAEGTGKINIPDGHEDNVGAAKIELAGDRGSVKIITLDSLVEDWRKQHKFGGSVNLIKVDVEGMELSVLKGAVDTITTYKPHLLLEAATAKDFGRLNNHLKSFGYKVVSRWAGTPVYHFCYKPPIALRLKVTRFKLVLRAKKTARKIMTKIKNLARAQNDHHGETQPALVYPPVGDVAHLGRGGFQLLRRLGA